MFILCLLTCCLGFLLWFSFRVEFGWWFVGWAWWDERRVDFAGL